MEVDIRKKEKVAKTMEFAERMKKVQEKTEATLRKAQKEIKQQVDKRRKETKKQKKEDEVILSIKIWCSKKDWQRNQWINILVYILLTRQKLLMQSTTNFNENSAGCKCQLSSKIQRASEETESRGSKTSRDR